MRVCLVEVLLEAKEEKVVEEACGCKEGGGIQNLLLLLLLFYYLSPFLAPLPPLYPP